MRDLRKNLREYIDLRRALGFRLRKHERRLSEFITFLEARRTDHVTTKLAIAWPHRIKRLGLADEIAACCCSPFRQGFGSRNSSDSDRVTSTWVAVPTSVAKVKGESSAALRLLDDGTGSQGMGARTGEGRNQIPFPHHSRWAIEP
jgi:hypothetical protein